MVVDKDPMARKLIELYIQKNKRYKLIKSIDNIIDIRKLCITYKIDLILWIFVQEWMLRALI